MRLADFLDKGASLSPSGAPCLTMAGQTRSYAAVQRLSWLVGRALARSGVRPGDKVAVLSGNDPVGFGCVFGISRAGAVCCPVSPRDQVLESRELLRLLDCRALLFAPAFGSVVAKIAPDLPKLATLVCLDSGDADAGVPGAVGFGEWVSGLRDDPWQADPVDDVVMIAGTGGSTGRPKGVQLTGRNIEVMTALTLMSYPFRSRPVYLTLAPLSDVAGVLSLPVMTLGGEVVIMPSSLHEAPDLGDFLSLIGKLRVTHAFLPPAVIGQLLDHPDLPTADLSSLECLWYCAAPMSAARLEQAIMARDGALLPVNHTGDIGYLDEDNCLYVIDRLTDMIITSASNVSSAEAEQALLAHPAVLDCAVVGLPDDRWGERVTAVIQVRGGQEVALDEIARFVRDTLGGVKAPKRVEIWPDLPRSAAGKIVKTEIKRTLLAKG